MDDVRAVIDAAGSQRAALLGVSEGWADVHVIRCHEFGTHACFE